MRKNIFIIDDDKDFIELYTQILSFEFNVRSVTNLRDAIAYLEENPFEPDLILCDIFMPETNGFEVYDFFKSQEKFEHLDIIFKTSSLNKSVYEESIINKGTELISTYMSIEEISARVRRALLNVNVIKVKNRENLVFAICRQTRKSLYPSFNIPIEFSETEVKILRIVSSSNSPIPKEKILKSCFPSSTVITDNNLNTTFSNLRKKLVHLNAKLVTRRNIGTEIHFIQE